GDRAFELVDTGGMGVVDVDNLTAHIEHQIDIAINAAQVILFVLDVRGGLTDLYQKVARRLRKVDKPVFYVANKCDAPALDAQAAELHRLGSGRLICVSAHQKRGTDDLLRLIVSDLPSQDAMSA